MNKLSELSKPVAWAFKDANDVDHASITKKANLYGRHDFQPLYSQDYVSALLAELESYKQYAKERDAENESLALTVGRLRAKLATPVRLPKTNGYWTEQEKAFEDAITLAKRAVRLAGFNVVGDE
jgi:regulator of replication initiation timing